MPNNYLKPAWKNGETIYSPFLLLPTKKVTGVSRA